MTLNEAIETEKFEIELYQKLGIDSDIGYINNHISYVKWFEELQRARTLLKAAYELFEKQDNSGYVLNLLSETVYYDDAECDGNCLMEDISYLLDESKINE